MAKQSVRRLNRTLTLLELLAAILVAALVSFPSRRRSFPAEYESPHGAAQARMK
jgi:hypothetical protein